MDPAELAAKIEEWIAAISSGDAEAAEAVADVVDLNALEGVTRDQYAEAMDTVMETYDVPEEVRDVYQEPLDAEGDYSPEGLRSNIEFLLQNEDISTAIDNSITVEGDADPYGDEHYGQDGGVRDINQHNTTNVANADGEGAIAGNTQEGQFQTGDGVQVGDYNDGVVNQGDNSGVQGGDYASADDVTTGDGNFNNDEGGTIDDSAIAFGGGDANNTANEVYDSSVNDSYNADDVGNVRDSYNSDNVGNTTHEADYDLDADLKVTEGDHYVPEHEEHPPHEEEHYHDEAEALD